VDPDDEFFGDTDPSTPKEDDDEDREQSEKTRLARLQEALSEAVLKKQLQVLFGPRSILDSLEMMRKIRMPGAPYSLLTAGSDYVESWKAAIIWCGGWHPRGSRNPNLPADRALKEVFLDNVRPQMLQAELRNMFCPTLNAMRTEFKKLYDKNYLILRAAAAVNGVTDSGQGDYSRDNTYRKMSISKENEIGRTLTQRSTSGPTDGRTQTRAGRVPMVTDSRPMSSPRTSEKDLSGITCYLCDKKGHYQSGCPLNASNGGKIVTSPQRPTNLSSAFPSINSPAKRDTSSVKFTSPVVSGKQSPPQWSRSSSPNGSSRGGAPGTRDDGRGPATRSSTGGRLNGAILRQAVEEPRAHIAVRIGPPGQTPTLQALAFADSGSDLNTMSRSWVPTLRAEGVVVQRIGQVEVRWTMESSGRVLDEVVTFRVDFIGWANAP
jgi:hypothetical protein